MATSTRRWPAALAATLLAVSAAPALAQSSTRDSIADLLRGSDPATDQAAKNGTGQTAADPRVGDPDYEQARRLMAAIDAILQDTAKNRSEAKRLPGKDEFLVPPLWLETREDRDEKVRSLLDSALDIVTDAPVVDIQERVQTLRQNIRDLEERIVEMRERQLTAPKESLLPGVFADTVESLKGDIAAAEERIKQNRAQIDQSKKQIHEGLAKSGVNLAPEQVDLLLESVLSGDLVKLIAAFNAAKVIDGQLSKLMSSAGDNMKAARKYFAMHAALFAILVRAQDETIKKIDTNYMPKLESVLRDIAAAGERTRSLMKAENRPDQIRALQANRDSQRVAEQAAKSYRRYLMQQREQIARARARATHDLNIADNTYETVEASYQLRNLMRDSSSSFEALQKLEAPTFEQIFKNEELRREFENLTRKLDGPTS